MRDEEWGLCSDSAEQRTPEFDWAMSTPQLVYNLTSLLTHETSTTVSLLS